MINEVNKLKTLYKRDSTGKVREWSVEVGYGDEVAAWRVITGIKDGKLVTSEWKYTEGKNVGKVNGTTCFTQADAEATAQITKQSDKGYFENVEDIDSFEKIKPMLAADYAKLKKPLEFPVYTQPKLDGIRCIARSNGLWSRAGKEIIAVPHVYEALKEFFEQNPDAILDGELYNHDLKDDFNKITSVVRKTKPSSEDIKEAKDLVHYHVYDVIMDAPLMDRVDFIQNQNFTYPIVPVVTTEVSDQAELDTKYAQYIGDGYEGQMVRTNGVYQQNKRSKFLMKRKEFITEEYDVIGVEEGKGNWSGCIKRFVLKLSNGEQFGAGVRGTQDQMKALLESGKTPDWATLRYFELTPDGVPRFPVVIDYGYGKRID